MFAAGFTIQEAVGYKKENDYILLKPVNGSLKYPNKFNDDNI